MKKITICIVLAMLCLFFRGFTQTFTPLKVGDTIPETLWQHSFQTITNREQFATFEFRSIKGKLIIIDFWATWCSSCIQAMPELHKLQKEYGDKIAIVSHTNEGAEKITTFLKVNKIAKENLEFSIIGDTILEKVFSHRLLPHFIWIDQLGIVKAVTSASEVNSENIDRVLGSYSVKIPSKIDLNPELPLFMGVQFLGNELLQYSVLSKGNFVGLASGNLYRKTNGILRGHAFTNTNLGTIYRIIARQIFKMKGIPFNSNQIVYKLDHPDKLREIYNYELLVPLSNASELYTNMLEDLNKNLPFMGKFIQSNGSTVLIITDKKHCIKSLIQIN